VFGRARVHGPDANASKANILQILDLEVKDLRDIVTDLLVILWWCTYGYDLQVVGQFIGLKIEHGSLLLTALFSGSDSR
jgi:hypothetical protein